MTVAAQETKKQHTANGVTTSFAYDFQVDSSSDLDVYIDDVIQTSGFTVSGLGVSTGGSVGFATAPDDGSTVTLERTNPFSRATDYGNAGDFLAETVNSDFDALVKMVQQLQTQLDQQALLFKTTQVRTKALNQIPSPSVGQVLSWQADGSLANTELSTLVGSIDISATIDRYSSIAALVAASPDDSLVYVTSYYDGWAATVEGPKGGQFLHKTGATNTAPTVGSAVSVSTIGTGTQAGYYWDASGVEWRISGERLNNFMFGDKQDGTSDSTEALNNGLAFASTLYVDGDGVSLASGLTSTKDYQSLVFSGTAIIRKNANGDLITFSGRDAIVENGRFEGNSASYTGHNIVKTNAGLILKTCSSKDAAGRAVYDSNGNNLRILGTNDTYQTADTSATGYDIEIAGSGIYSKITDIYTSISTGGILINGAGTVSILGSQFGKLTWQGGTSGGYVNNCRINGAVTIEAGGVALGVCSVSANVTIGDGSTSFSQITMSPNFTMQSGTTLNITNGVQDSKFPNLDTLRNNGVTVTIGASTDNDYFDGRVSYTPTWAGGSPSIGNGTITGYYTRRGRTVNLSVSIQFGSTTTFGSGSAWTFSLPIAAASVLARMVGACLMEDSSSPTFYSGMVEVQASGSTCTVKINGAGTVTPSAPFTWASGDRLSFNVEYEV